MAGLQGKQEGWHSVPRLAKEGSCQHRQGVRGGSEEENTIWGGPPERTGILGTEK